MNTAPTNPLRLIRLAEVMSRTGLSRPYVYKLVSAGRFPAYVKVGSATTWIESEIESWIESRISESRQGVAA